MAEKLSIVVALEGGAIVEQQLAGIGEAGEKAFRDITKAAEQASGFKNLNTNEVEAGLKRLGAVGPDAINKITAAVRQAGRLEGIVEGVRGIEDGFAKLGTVVDRTANKMAGALGPLAGLARALGPVGIAAGLMGAAVVKGTFDAVNAINALNAAAIKLGVPIEQLQNFIRTMEQAGIATQAITAGLAKVQGDIEKFKLDQVTKNFRELQAAFAEGFSGAGSKALRELKEEAENFTPAGKAAREALASLDFPLSGTTLKDVKELGTELAKLKGMGIDIKVDDTAVVRMQKIIDALVEMPDSAKRTQIAIQFLGEELGTELVEGLQAGGFELDKFKAKVDESERSLKQQAIEGTKFREALNILTKTWREFNSITLSPAMRGIFNFLSADLQRFKTDLIGLGADLTRLGQLMAAVWNNPTAALGNLVNNVRNLASALASMTWDSFSAGATAAFSSVASGLQQLASQIAAFVSAPVEGAWQWLAETFAAVVASINEAWQAVVDGITSLITKPVEDAWQWIVNSFNSAMDAVLAKARQVWEEIKSLFSGSPVQGGSTGAPAGPGFARGGHVGGRGSGMSDSNLAWVSRGEHIMPARAVAQPGVLAFLEALRRSGGNLRHVLDGMGRFALGGMVPAMPAFASGGLNGMSNVTIQFPGLQPIGGLRAPASVVDELRKAAAMAQVRSGGTKPSRYR